MAKKLVGKVTHYYSKIGVAIIDLAEPLTVGDEVSIEGASTNVKQVVDSMQVEHESVKTADRGNSVGMKVPEKVRPGDNVYREE